MTQSHLAIPQTCATVSLHPAGWQLVRLKRYSGERTAHAQSPEQIWVDKALIVYCSAFPVVLSYDLSCAMLEWSA